MVDDLTRRCGSIVLPPGVSTLPDGRTPPKGLGIVQSVVSLSTPSGGTTQQYVMSFRDGSTYTVTESNFKLDPRDPVPPE